MPFGHQFGKMLELISMIFGSKLSRRPDLLFREFWCRGKTFPVLAVVSLPVLLLLAAVDGPTDDAYLLPAGALAGVHGTGQSTLGQHPVQELPWYSG